MSNYRRRTTVKRVSHFTRRNPSRPKLQQTDPCVCVHSCDVLCVHRTRDGRGWGRRSSLNVLSIFDRNGANIYAATSNTRRLEPLLPAQTPGRRTCVDGNVISTYTTLYVRNATTLRRHRASFRLPTVSHRVADDDAPTREDPRERRKCPRAIIDRARGAEPTRPFHVSERPTTIVTACRLVVFSWDGGGEKRRTLCGSRDTVARLLPDGRRPLF